MDDDKVFQVVDDECCLTVTVDTDDQCALVVETEHDHFKARGIDLDLLLGLLDRIRYNDYDMGF